MKRDFLKGLGLEKDVINEIMKMHGLAMLEMYDTNNVDEARAENLQLEERLMDLQKQLESQDTESIKLDVERLKKEIEGYKLKELKWQIVNECRLPFDMADRLIGTTYDELRVDAQRLLKCVELPPKIPITFRSKDSRLLI